MRLYFISVLIISPYIKCCPAAPVYCAVRQVGSEDFPGTAALGIQAVGGCPILRLYLCAFFFLRYRLFLCLRDSQGTPWRKYRISHFIRSPCRYCVFTCLRRCKGNLTILVCNGILYICAHTVLIYQLNLCPLNRQNLLLFTSRFVQSCIRQHISL